MAKDFRRVRDRLGLDRHEFGEFLGISYESLMNIENGVRNPNRLAEKLVGYVAGLPKEKALEFIKEFKPHEPK